MEIVVFISLGAALKELFPLREVPILERDAIGEKSCSFQ